MGNVTMAGLFAVKICPPSVLSVPPNSGAVTAFSQHPFCDFCHSLLADWL